MPTTHADNEAEKLKREQEATAKTAEHLAVINATLRDGMAKDQTLPQRPPQQIDRLDDEFAKRLRQDKSMQDVRDAAKTPAEKIQEAARADARGEPVSPPKVNEAAQALERSAAADLKRQQEQAAKDAQAKLDAEREQVAQAQKAADLAKELRKVEHEAAYRAASALVVTPGLEAARLEAARQAQQQGRDADVQGTPAVVAEKKPEASKLLERRSQPYSQQTQVQHQAVDIQVQRREQAAQVQRDQASEHTRQISRLAERRAIPTGPQRHEPLREQSDFRQRAAQRAAERPQPEETEKRASEAHKGKSKDKDGNER